MTTIVVIFRGYRKGTTRVGPVRRRE
jgi:hypothetical protein